MKRLFLIFLFCFSVLFDISAQSYIKYQNNPIIDTLSTTDPSQFWTRWKTDPYVIHWNNDSLRMYYGTNNYGVQTIQDLKEALKKESLKDNEDRLSELQGVNFTHLTVITNTPYDITGRVGEGFGKTERARNLDKNPLQSQLVKDYKEGKIKPEI